MAMTASGVVQASGRASRVSASWPPTKVQTSKSVYARSNVQGRCDAPTRGKAETPDGPITSLSWGYEISPRSDRKSLRAVSKRLH